MRAAHAAVESAAIMLASASPETTWRRQPVADLIIWGFQRWYRGICQLGQATRAARGTGRSLGMLVRDSRDLPCGRLTLHGSAVRLLVSGGSDCARIPASGEGSADAGEPARCGWASTGPTGSPAQHAEWMYARCGNATTPRSAFSPTGSRVPPEGLVVHVADGRSSDEWPGA